MSGASYLAKSKPKRVRPQTDYLHINNLFEHQNQAIDKENQAIGDKNMAIEARIAEIKLNIQTKTNIEKLYKSIGTEKIFGRSDISEICNISYSAAGSLIAKMKEHNLLEDVKGHGKGRYQFKVLSVD